MIGQNIKILLVQAEAIVERHVQLSKRLGHEFNLFSILDRESDEVKCHSAILATLLNPDGSHGQGDLFLRLFFKQLHKHGGEFAKTDLADLFETIWSVASEKSFRCNRASGQLDIIIESSSMAIIIENKIHAADQDRQLARYWDYGQANKLDTYLFYLTLNGREPDPSSLVGLCSEGRSKLKCISYSEFVSKWIADCIKHASTLPYIRESLCQYQDLIRKLSINIGNRDMTMDIIKQIENPDSLKAGIEIANAIPLVKGKILRTFWEKLDAALTKAFGKDNIWQAEDADDHYDNGVDNFYLNNKKSGKGYGLRLTVEEIDEDDTLDLFICIDWRLWYRFEASVDGETLKDFESDPAFKKVLDVLSNLEPTLKKAAYSWWRYALNEKGPNFHEFDDKCILLVDEDNMNEYVNKIASEVVGVVHAIQKEYAKKCR